MQTNPNFTIQALKELESRLDKQDLDLQIIKAKLDEILTMLNNSAFDI